MKHRDYFSLCAKRLSGEISTEEDTDLDKWLSRSPENRKRMEEMTAAWRMSEPGSLPVTPDAASGWRVLERSLGLDRPAPEPGRVKRFVGSLREALLHGRGFRATAVSFASLLLIVSSLWLLGHRTSEPRLLTAATSNRQKIEVILPDGSRVRLNSGSAIQYPEKFSADARKIELSGEAFFDVAHDGRTFVVTTGNASATVLGTRFNLWAREGRTRLIVQDGKVALESGRTTGRAVLTRNQMCGVDRDGRLGGTEPADADRLLGWLKGRLVFDRTPVPEVLSEIGRTFDVIVDLDDAGLASRTVTADFEHPSLETVLSSLCLTLNAKVRRDSGKFVLYTG
jgi:transmembrane sensor